MDIIGITQDAADAVSTPEFIDLVNLIDNHIIKVDVSEERLADFRQRVHFAFQKSKKRLMSVLHLGRRINLGNKEKFSKMEMDSAMLLLEDANEIFNLNLNLNLKFVRCFCVLLTIQEE